MHEKLDGKQNEPSAVTEATPMGRTNKNTAEKNNRSRNPRAESQEPNPELQNFQATEPQRSRDEHLASLFYNIFIVLRFTLNFFIYKLNFFEY